MPCCWRINTDKDNTFRTRARTHLIESRYIPLFRQCHMQPIADKVLAVVQRLTWDTRAAQLASKIGIGRLIRRVIWRRAFSSGILRTALAGYTFSVRIRQAGDVERVQKFWREHALITRLLSQIRRGDILWDVGANVGLITLVGAAALRPRNGQVIAFEPHPDLYDQLVENVELNELSNVRTHRFALGDQSTTDYLHAERSPGKGTHSLIESDSRIGIEVLVRSPASLFDSGEQPPDIMKIDVEGTEDQVIRGCRLLPHQRKPREIFIELHPLVMGIDATKELHDVLTTAGFMLLWSLERGDEEQRHYARRDEPHDLL